MQSIGAGKLAREEEMVAMGGTSRLRKRTKGPLLEGDNCCQEQEKDNIEAICDRTASVREPTARIQENDQNHWHFGRCKYGKE